MKIFYTLFAIYVLSHVYVFTALRRAFGSGKWQIPVAVWLGLMAAVWFLRIGKPLGPIGEKFQDISYFWMGFLILFCYCLITADALNILTKILAYLSPGRCLHALSDVCSSPRLVPLAFTVGLLLFAASLYSAQHPTITRVNVVTSKLAPGTAPLRIIGISDLHISSLIGQGTLRRLAAKITALDPDIVVMAGDLVDTDISMRQEEADILSAIPARLGKYAVTGNHEFYHGTEQSMAYIRQCGFTLLRGEAVHVGDIIVAGVDDDSFARKYGRATVDPMPMLTSAPRDRFLLLLNHKPYYPKEGVGLFDLQFSGHTHAGQFWPGKYVTRSIYGLDQGMTELEYNGKKSLIYLTNGTGFWGPPIRFLARPEIVEITLLPEN